MKNVLLIIFFASILNFGTSAQETVQIGSQIWATKNLVVSTFRNGDAIPEAKTKEEWEQASLTRKAVWAYYENDPANGEKYGKIYNWYAVNDKRGLAPEGWAIPFREDWTEMNNQLDGYEIAGKKLKGLETWDAVDGKNGAGDNSSGFNGLAGGYRFHDGSFYDLGKSTGYWLASENYPIGAWYCYLTAGVDEAGRHFANRGAGFYVRMMKVE